MGGVPDYRGNHGIFFAYERSDFDSIGASLHLVSRQLDEGHLIDVFRPVVLPHDHDEHLYCRAAHGGAVRLRTLLQGLECGEKLTSTPQVGVGTTFRHRDRTPGRELRLWLRRRLGLHRVPHLPARIPPERAPAGIEGMPDVHPG